MSELDKYVPILLVHILCIEEEKNISRNIVIIVFVIILDLVRKPDSFSTAKFLPLTRSG